MSVEIRRRQDCAGWLITTPNDSDDFNEFDGITSQLVAIVLGWADQVEEYGRGK